MAKLLTTIVGCRGTIPFTRIAKDDLPRTIVKTLGVVIDVLIAGEVNKGFALNFGVAEHE